MQERPWRAATRERLGSAWAGGMLAVEQSGIKSFGAFAFFFGTVQALYMLSVPLQAAHEPGPDKTVVVLDGSELAGDDPPSFDSLLKNPSAVLTYDSDGRRKPSEDEKLRQERAAAVGVIGEDGGRVLE